MSAFHVSPRVVARKLRLEYEGAFYHVINRGNYRFDIFGSAGAARAFETTLAEACETLNWRLHAYVIMRNHFHLALETPDANLIRGMHWLQSTYATRFNRLRDERGHVFQGRYQALVVQDASALARVANYIHLNPVRAGLVSPSLVGAFRWSSLSKFISADRPNWLRAEWLAELGLNDDKLDWQTYVRRLVELAGDPGAQAEQGFSEMARGWAIGTSGWKKALAKDQAQRRLPLNADGEAVLEIAMQKWEISKIQILHELGKTLRDVASDPKGASWKIEAAARLRRAHHAAYRWIAAELNMGRPASVRVYVAKHKLINSALTPL